jgi:isoleucyl-tRNA synthetase
VRRSRDRFWGSADAADTRAAFRTLHEVLEVLARLLAPFTPFHADWLHRALTRRQRAPRSVPERAGDGPLRDERLEEGMRIVRILARLGRAARER